ncbi:MAG: NAD(P)H-dependent oxidoreductase subunit E [bacterium]|nr:NAD(P)H-dependent oxidoreductase subunit E [bacterium]
MDIAMSQFIEQTCQKYANSKEALVMILQDVQKRYKGLSEPALREIAQRLQVPLSQVYGVASFYKEFQIQELG